VSRRDRERERERRERDRETALTPDAQRVVAGPRALRPVPAVGVVRPDLAALAPRIHRVELPLSLRSVVAGGRTAPLPLRRRRPPRMLIVEEDRRRVVVVARSSDAALRPSVDVRPPRTLAPRPHAVVGAPSPLVPRPLSQVPTPLVAVQRLVLFVPFFPGRVAVGRAPPALSPRLQAVLPPLPFGRVLLAIFVVSKYNMRVQACDLHTGATVHLWRATVHP